MKQISTHLYAIEPTGNLPRGGIRVIVPIWKGGKKQRTLSVADYSSKRACRDAAEDLRIQFKAELKAEVEAREAKENPGSLTSYKTLADVAHERVKLYGYGGMECYYETIIRDCGASTVDLWREMYVLYIRKLETVPTEVRGVKKVRAPSTINHYKQVFRTLFKFAKDEGLIDRLPVKVELESDYGRDRVWSMAERNAVFKEMEDSNSYLWAAVYFSERNPIRAGDLFGLTRDNWNPEKNWVEFFASKTMERKNRKTYLKQIDYVLRDHFDSLPPDCPYLFPRFLKSGQWVCAHANRNFNYSKEWKRVLVDADPKVEDFHFHDLKHIALTYLLDNGYSERDLKNCGIQYTKTMIDRYYHHDAEKAPVIAGYELPKLRIAV